jgi:hypothetical protein
VAYIDQSSGQCVSYGLRTSRTLSSYSLSRYPAVRCGLCSATQGRVVDGFAGADLQPPRVGGGGFTALCVRSAPTLRLLRASVNKGKKKGQSGMHPGP